MIKVLAACGNGMGSSLIVKMKIEKVLRDMELECVVDHASISQAKIDAAKFDLVLVSEVFVKEFTKVGAAKVVGLLNLLSEEEIKSKVKTVLNL